MPPRTSGAGCSRSWSGPSGSMRGAQSRALRHAAGVKHLHEREVGVFVDVALESVAQPLNSFATALGVLGWKVHIRVRESGDVSVVNLGLCLGSCETAVRTLVQYRAVVRPPRRAVGGAGRRAARDTGISAVHQR
jgi:hypothetical protein